MKHAFVSALTLSMSLASLHPLLAGAATDPAAAYPQRPIRIVVPQSPGGATDFVGRLTAGLLAQRTGQSVVVDNRAGAASMVGTDLVAKSAPDGYTLLVAPSSLSTIPSMYKNVPFDSVKDLAPITTLSVYPNVVVVNPNLPAKSIRDLIALAKAKPGELNYSSGGTGTGTQLGAELFNSMAGVKIVHVPYKGGGPAVSALIAGEVNIHFAPMSSAIPIIKSGRVRALAVTSGKRSPTYPDLPTVAESGVPGYDQTTWNGLLAPSRTPPSIIKKINAAVLASLKLPSTHEHYATAGLEPGGTTPEEFGTMIKTEIAKWAKVIKEAGIKPE